MDTEHVSNGVLRIESRRDVRLAVGDTVLGFARGDDSVKFLWTARVESSPEPEGEAPALRVWMFGLSAPKAFEAPRRLADYAYSLRGVHHFTRPEVHFRRPYRALTDRDFRAVLEGSIFWARTAVGMFLNALPRSVALEFIIERTLSPGESLSGAARYRKAWNELADWIGHRYLAAYPLLEPLEALAREVSDDPSFGGFTLETLSVGDDVHGKDPLKPMVANFQRLRDAEMALEGGVLAHLRNWVEQSQENDARFAEAFREEAWTWPIERGS